ncbi:serine--tRNA ligase, partial [Candidatus Woesebacteria bacterium]|nr:serine--tRNA ligase [Candidatus Woesebacteria bacterium]
MLDINIIRENPDAVRQACSDKQLDPTVVDKLLTADESRRQLQQKVDALRQQSNEHARGLKQRAATGTMPTEAEKETGKTLKNDLKAVEPELKELEEAVRMLALQVPNIPASDVPVGKDESGNQLVRQVGTPSQMEFEPKPHEEIMTKLDWLDTERAVKIGGFRSYFLKGDGLRLEQKLLTLALNRLSEAGFTPMSVPVLVNEASLWGTGYFPWGKEDHYQTQDNQFLTGTAEVALTAYRQGEMLTEKDLPLQICGISPCFRREVGSYGKDTQGIVRVHQFNKVEQVVYTVADEAETRVWHEKM